jgi:hypothetical protein
MRLTGLLALLLFVVIVFFAAPAASYAQTASAAAVKSDNTDFNSPAILPEKWQPTNRVNEHPLVASQPLIEHNGDLVLRESLPDSRLTDDFTCLKLRTYIVARDDKTSDATHLVRKVNCTPARKFAVKSADVRVEAPAETKPGLK